MTVWPGEALERAEPGVDFGSLATLAQAGRSK